MAEYRHVFATRQGNRQLRSVSGAQQWGRSTVPPRPGEATMATSAVQIAAVYGSVGLLADGVATMPVRLLDSPVLRNAQEIKPSQLVLQPYVEMSRIDWWVQFVWGLALRGEFIGLITERDADLYAQQIKPLDVDQVSIRRNQGGVIEYRFGGKLLNTDDVFHVKNHSWPGMIRGLNPIEILRTTFGLALNQDKYGESFFRNSADPHGVIEVPDPLEGEETEALLMGWLSKHQGVGQANLPAVLTGGATWKPIGINPEDAQFLAARGFSATEISGMIFHVPPHKLGLTEKSTSFGRGIEQQEQSYTLDTLQGYIARGEEALTALHPPGQYVKLNLEHRLRGDSLERATTSSLMMLAGAWCADDARARFDMPPVPKGQGQNFFAPINTELLQAAIAQAQALKAAADNPALPAPAGNGPKT